MALSYRDAAVLLALLEGHMTSKAEVLDFVKEAIAKNVGGKGSKQTWARILELLSDSGLSVRARGA
jgi:hypothetical protein